MIQKIFKINLTTHNMDNYTFIGKTSESDDKNDR